MTIFACVLTLGSVNTASVMAQTPAVRYFNETGHSVGGLFLQYWQGQGGLAVFGYPITDEIIENGRSVQYFERNRFEFFPENINNGNAVLLGLFGTKLARDKGIITSAPFNRVVAVAGVRYFNETGHSLRGAFLNYWNKYGGLAIFGFPISEEFSEGGRIVQYFERARFEFFSELPQLDFVQLGRLSADVAEKTLDPSLRQRWNSPATPLVLVQVQTSNAALQPLDEVTVKAAQSGQLRVLGGDNRGYVSYNLEANRDLKFKVGGAVGTQSLLLFQEDKLIGRNLGAYRVFSPEMSIKNGDPAIDNLYGRTKSLISGTAVNYRSPDDYNFIVRGYRSSDTPFVWLRDHVHAAKGFKYFEPDMRSLYDYFKTSQKPDGSFDDYFLDNSKEFRAQIEVEADREYLFVEGVYQSWRATGDDVWLRGLLPIMERGLQYTFTNPKRWSTERGLVKRAFTIDTWDFEYNTQPGITRRTIDKDTIFGIMHGDNTGAYASARRLAQFYRYFGMSSEANSWENRAAQLKTNLMATSWNGRFFTHRVDLSGRKLDLGGTNEAEQLSLSNSYALNRGILNQAEAAAIIREYQGRRGKAFAEWYSLDPPFNYGFSVPGEYVNGGIMPLVGGELARGAFEYGFEAYGLDILHRYWQLISSTGGSYLWYYPDGKPGIITETTLPSDGWGSAAMLNALVEGLAGVEDSTKQFEAVTLSPRWAVSEQPSATVNVRYGATEAYFSYRWQRGTNNITMQWAGGFTNMVRLRLMLPPGVTSLRSVTVDGQAQPYTIEQVGNSTYVDLFLPGYVPNFEVLW